MQVCNWPWECRENMIDHLVILFTRLPDAEERSRKGMLSWCGEAGYFGIIKGVGRTVNSKEKDRKLICTKLLPLFLCYLNHCEFISYEKQPPYLNFFLLTWHAFQISDMMPFVSLSSVLSKLWRQVAQLSCISQHTEQQLKPNTMLRALSLHRGAPDWVQRLHNFIEKLGAIFSMLPSLAWFLASCLSLHSCKMAASMPGVTFSTLRPENKRRGKADRAFPLHARLSEQ